MLNIQITDFPVVVAFWLTFSRLIAIIFQIPLFDNTAIPTMIKVLTSLLISYVMFPYVQAEVLKDIAYMGVENFWMLTIGYTLVGLLIGFLVKSIMSLFISSGSIITQQMGFGAMRYFDPSSGQQVGPFEKLLQWTVLIMILTSGALIPMFKGIYQSFFSIHLYDFGKLGGSVPFYLNLFKSLFASSILLASPLIFTNMLLNTVLGIIARMVPQMNVIMVSFAVNIGLGLLVFATSSEEFFRVAFKMYTERLGDWFQFVI